MRHVCRRVVIVFLLCCVSLLLFSCSSRYPSLQKFADLPEEGVCRIAVLPFDNQSNYRDGNLLFYRVFTSEFSRIGDFALSTEGDMRHVLRQLRFRPGSQSLNFDKLRTIGDYLHAEILIIGTIVEMKEMPSRDQPDEFIPVMTISLKLFDVATGRTLVTMNHTRSGEEYRKVMHFGLISTITQLAEQMTKEMLTLLVSEGFTGKCTE